MPRRDGTGPEGQGAVTGRGLGQCTGVNAGGIGRLGRGLGLGLGRGRGSGRFFARNSRMNDEKSLLREEKNILKSRLDAIERVLNEETEK